MTVYLVAQLRFTNRAAYNRYQARFMDVFSNFSGKLLIADESPAILEGQWAHEKLVMMSFSDEATARSFLNDPSYQEIAKDRKAGADTVILLAKGVRSSEHL